MHDANGGPANMVGPSVERVTYVSEEHREAERMYFWMIVASLFNSFDGEYEDVPSCFREEGTAQLLGNN